MRLAAMFALVSLMCALILIGTQGESTAHLPASAALQLEGNGRIISEGSYQTDRSDGSDFGPALLHEASAHREFRLHNLSESMMYFGPMPGWQSEGPQAAEFQLAAPLPLSLAPGASLPFHVQFKPKALGLRTTMIRIPYRSADGNDEVHSLDFRVEGQGVGLGSLLVRALGDGREILSGDVVSNDLEDHWSGNLPSHVLIDPAGSLRLRLINRAQNSLLPLDTIRISGPQAADFSLSYPSNVTQLQSSEELMLQVRFDPRGRHIGLRQALLSIETGDAVVPRFELLLIAYRGPESDG